MSLKSLRASHKKVNEDIKTLKKLDTNLYIDEYTIKRCKKKDSRTIDDDYYWKGAKYHDFRTSASNLIECEEAFTKFCDKAHQQISDRIKELEKESGSLWDKILELLKDD